ncbi:MAG: hypothetical protein VX762_00195 [Bacteroidota bacterium]|nr:hypothetical protein [Bacteroidota bacterium]
MKKLLLILLCFPIIALAQKTYVPDDDFEQSLINLGFDTVLNDSVLTSSIDTISSLHLGFFINNIYDLTGIEDFSALKDLTIWQQFLTSLDVSQNTLLESLNCTGNDILHLDLSNNTALTSLVCSENQLISLNIKNNNNILLLNTTNNLTLSCINVDDSAFAANNWINNIDPQHYFSNDCNTTTTISEVPTKNKLIKVIDIFGRETIPKLNSLIFYIYEDGKIEKNIVIEPY